MSQLSPAEEILTYLDAHGTIDLIKGRDLFIGHQPEDPTECTVVYDTGGGDQSDRIALDEVTIQILTRSRTYRTGFQELSEIKLDLQSISGFNLTDHKLIGVWIQTPVTSVGRDSKDRNLFTLNLRLILEPNSKGHRQ